MSRGNDHAKFSDNWKVLKLIHPMYATQWIPIISGNSYSIDQIVLYVYTAGAKNGAKLVWAFTFGTK